MCVCVCGTCGVCVCVVGTAYLTPSLGLVWDNGKDVGL